ncbi:PQQ-binding-like beta-propeller repeat protein [Vitiosangium sp. GDMCC 1.1324]|uniref:outer membrane protein assembly factor BamB family protein n=1 Tax=Vitiosangium sp. (strain GDMCC 1.1324) TaxID=2138576 RepID=UPI000D3A0068|nr:PQQ-binding-like beta-propeller repeat protein [Vitiosangium sp. GDMCC 1.1324]PTL85879.1 dehydrogenase [Vitiosangium sp. GDMCC 1.1324]
MRIASRWKRWVGGLAAAGLLGGCSTVPVYGNPVTGAPVQPPHHFFSVDWWSQLVAPSLLEYAPREQARPAYDSKNERIITLTRDGYVRSFTTEGREAWRFQVGTRFYAGATVEDGIVYVPGTDGVLYALDGKTGEPKWKYASGEALATEPVLAGELVLVASQSDTLFAVKRDSGALAWLYRRDPPTGFTIHRASTPAVRGQTAWVGFSDGTLVSLDLTDGSARWEKALAPGGATQFLDVDTTPALDESGHVFAASYAGGLYSLDAETGDVVWNSVAQGITSVIVHAGVVVATGDDRMDAYLADSGRQLWSQTLQERAALEPVLVKGMILVPAQRSLLFVDPRTGRSHMAWNPGEGVSAPPRVVGAKAYVLSNNGYLYALRLNGRSG